MKKKSIIALCVCLCTFTLGMGVFAAEIIERYKTVRGTMATVERMDVHKNRIAVHVNGQEVKTDTWYADGVTYVPIRDVSTMLAADVSYDGKTQTGYINTQKNGLARFGLEMNKPYYATLTGIRDIAEYEFRITAFDPATQKFQGTMTNGDNGEVVETVIGTLTQTGFFLTHGGQTLEMKWDASERYFTSDSEQYFVVYMIHVE